jgi:hypothetical protein
MEATMRISSFVSTLFLIFISPAILFSQISFERTYGGDSYDFGWSVQQTADNGFVIAGYTRSFGAGDDDVYLIKTDSSGDTLWTRTYGGESWDVGFSVQQTTDEGYVIVGATDSYGTGHGDVYLIRTDSSGDTLWTRTYGGDSLDEGYSVQQTEDGGYVISGYTESFGAGNRYVYLIKTDSSGDTLWTRTYGGDSYDEGWSVQQTTDGGYVITGDIDGDISLIKTDSSGDTLWTRTYGSGVWNGGSVGRSVQQTTDGGYVIAGYRVYFTMKPASTRSEVLLMKTDSSGDTLWTKTYGDRIIWGAHDEGSSVQQTTDGGYVLTGHTDSFCFGENGVYLMKTDSSGISLWTRTYGGTYWNKAYSVQQTNDEGYVIVGTTGLGAGEEDVYLIKTDPDGSVGITDNKPSSMKLPRSWALSQNYPNPFNPSTTISFDIPEFAGTTQHVNLTVYDIRGRRVKILIDSVLEPGRHTIHWDGRDNRGQSISSGIYLYTLNAGGETYTRKMTMLK